MIPKTFKDFYGDSTRWFVGHVIDVNDPKQLGRVKVRAIGVYDNIEEKYIPWAQIVVPITTGIHEGKGQNLGILVDTQVFGMFLDGQSSQLPIVLGAIPKEGDANAKGISEGEPYSIQNDIQVPQDAYSPEYPNNKVYETSGGHYIEIDDTEGKERIKQYHKSGTFYQIQPNGDIITHIVNDNYTVIAGNDSIHVKGNVTIICDNNVDLSASNVTANVSGLTLVDCPQVNITGSLRVDGGVSVGNDVNTDEGVSLNNHTHNVAKVKPGTATIKSNKPN